MQEIYTSVKESQKEYWEDRARAPRTVYRGEQFYTVTEVPLYYRRRQILLDRLTPILEAYASADDFAVLDFGCGDGFYSMYFGKEFDRISFYGCDLSQEFIDSASRASSELRNVFFQEAEDAIPFDRTFDVILIILVLAHVPEGRHEAIVKQLRQRCRKGTRVVLFEQTAVVPREGPTWARRTEGYYEALFTTNGFKLVSKELIAFPFFTALSKYTRMMISYLAGLLKRLRLTRQAAYVRKQNNSILIVVYEVLLALSRLLDRFFTPKEGNTLFQFEAGD